MIFERRFSIGKHKTNKLNALRIKAFYRHLKAYFLTIHPILSIQFYAKPVYSPAKIKISEILPQKATVFDLLCDINQLN